MRKQTKKQTRKTPTNARPKPSARPKLHIMM